MTDTNDVFDSLADYVFVIEKIFEAIAFQDVVIEIFESRSKLMDLVMSQSLQFELT